MVRVDGVNPDVVRVLPNGIPELAAISGTNLRDELGISVTAPLIAMVSQLRTEKRIDLLVDAVVALGREFPDVVAVVAGRGPEEPRLRELIRQNGLEEKVFLLGPRVDVPRILASADVAVSCSDFEGSPLSIMEYMAAGKAIVATRVGGIPELVDDGIHALLVEPRSVDGLAQAVARLLRDPPLRKRLAEQARIRQQREFTIEAMVRRLEALYEELFATTERARREGWTRGAGQPATAAAD
jgi:glycosyltransferase involved in cell wall biosynthesis